MATLAELREAKLTLALEEAFPGATWLLGLDETSPPSASTLIGHVDEVPADHAPSKESSETPRGTGGYAVIVGSTYDAVPIRKWASTLKEGTLILVGSPRFSKNGVPMNGEAVLMDAGNATEIEWGEDYLGKNFRNLQPGLLLATARADDLTVVLFGSGKKIDQVKNELAKWYPELPTSVVDC